MLFADLVGSTELATSLDPEDLRGRLEPFFQAARGALEQHGGTVEKYIGDAVMAVFGAPVSHGDDPDRAIAAALAVVERVRGSTASSRCGSGSRPARSSPCRQRRPARHRRGGQRRRPPAAGRRAGRGARRRAHRARLPASPARAQRRASRRREWMSPCRPSGRSRSATRRSSRPIPLIGREDDLDMLRLIARRAAREQLPQLVTVIGEAGIGKTRLGGGALRGAALRRAGGRWSAAARPTATASPSGRSARSCTTPRGRSTDARRTQVEPALRAVLEEVGADDAAELAAALVVAIRGAEEGADAEDELKRAWRRFVALLATDRPLAIGVDDAHWADEGTLEPARGGGLRADEAPVLILCTSRPELAERRPEFGRAARNNTQLELLPLDATPATHLAELLLPEDRRRPPRGSPTPRAATRSSPRRSRAGSARSRGTGPERLPGHRAGGDRRADRPAAPEEKRALQYASVLGPHLRPGTRSAICSTSRPQTCSGPCGAGRWSRSGPPRTSATTPSATS